MATLDFQQLLTQVRSEFTPQLPESEVKRTVPRKFMRSTAERGLPDFPSLVALAQCWVADQHQYWPSLVTSGELPDSTPAVAEGLAQAFQRRFLGMMTTQYNPHTVLPEGTRIGAAYSRFSCEKNNPASIQQQLHRILKLAHEQNVFVPWELVFGDAGVSGLVTVRHNYRLLKAVMAASNPSCFSVLYLDEFSRLSRRLIETLIFMETAKSHNIEVVSVTQRFDPTTPMGKMLLSLLGEMAENSSRETADRCERGHDHAWRVTKTSVKHPALGYLRVVARDTNGQPLLGANQKQLYREDIDPDTAPFVKMAFLLRAQKLKSRMEIARLFNTHNVGGRNRWGDSCIRQLFQRRDYIGVEVHASTKTVRHPQTGVSKRIPQPENLWKTRLMPHKRIISDELFNAVQLIEKQVADSFTSKFKGPRRARNELHATTPLSGVLICGYCGKPLGLGKAGSYAEYRCLNGINHSQGCILDTYRNVRQVSTAIIEHLREVLITDEMLDRLVRETQTALDIACQGDQHDTGKLQGKAKNLETRNQTLLKSLERQTGEALRELIMRKLQANLNDLEKVKSQLATAKSRHELKQITISKTEVVAALEPLWALLNQGDPTEVSMVLRALTGPIKITQTKLAGDPKPVWVAEFKADLIAGLAALGIRQKGFNPEVWTQLNKAGIEFNYPTKLPLIHRDIFARMGPKVKALVDNFAQRQGTRDGAIAHAADALDLHWYQARDYLVFAETGQRPKTKVKPKKLGQKRRPDQANAEAPAYLKITQQVKEMRDLQRRSWPEIAQVLGYCEPTCKRAYAQSHKAEIAAAAAQGVKIWMGRGSKLTPEQITQLRQEVQPYLDCPMSTKEVDRIAKLVSCSSITVHRERNRMRLETPGQPQITDRY